MTKDLRHSCYAGEEFWPAVPSTGDWVQLGAYGAVMVWEEDGLERTAQWSANGGLHVFTRDLHRGCIRVVCSWPKAKSIVAVIRKGNMEARMEKTDAVVSKLVDATGHHVAVVVVGGYGSGKVWMCDMAVRRLGLDARTINAAVLDEFEVERLFKDVPVNTGLILDDVHKANLQLLPNIAQAATKFVREEYGVLFITVPPGQENVLSLFATATGETLGLQQIVEVSK